MKSAMAFFVLLLLCAAPARADTLDDAQAAYLSGDFAKATRLALQYLEQDLHFPEPALGEPVILPGQSRPQAIAEYWISFAMDAVPVGGKPHPPLAGLPPKYWGPWARAEEKDLPAAELAVLNRMHSGTEVDTGPAATPGTKRCIAIRPNGEKQFYCSQLIALPSGPPQVAKPAYRAPAKTK